MNSNTKLFLDIFYFFKEKAKHNEILSLLPFHLTTSLEKAMKIKKSISLKTVLIKRKEEKRI